jgi:hypothetical protein
MGQPVPAYGRPGGGVRPDHPVIARNAYIAAEIALVAAPSLMF